MPELHLLTKPSLNLLAHGFSAQKVTTPLSVSVGYSFQGKIVTVTYLME